MAAMFRVALADDAGGGHHEIGWLEAGGCCRRLAHLCVSWPWGAQALALPELAMMPLATPSSRCSMVMYRGAAFTRFMVYMAAAVHSCSERIMARSFLPER